MRIGGLSKQEQLCDLRRQLLSVIFGVLITGKVSLRGRRKAKMNLVWDYCFETLGVDPCVRILFQVTLCSETR
ncbi:MAG: hypothetical protein CL862_12660 [Cyanobium sp. NAT70]|nr:hypothetical protein [Cyanobium sp. NAT70]